MLSLSSIPSKSFHRTDRITVPSVPPKESGSRGRKKGSKVMKVFDEAIGRWRSKVFNPEMLAAAGAVAQQEKSSAPPATALESEGESSSNEPAKGTAGSAPTAPSFKYAPLSPAQSIIDCQEAESLSTDGAPLVPTAPVKPRKIKLVFNQVPASMPALDSGDSTIIMDCTNSLSTDLRRPIKRRRTSSVEPMETIRTPRQAPRTGKSDAPAPPDPLRRLPNAQPRPHIPQPAKVEQPIKRPSSAAQRLSKRPFKVRTPSPSLSAASEAESDLIVIEEEHSATPVTWVPPEASPPPSPVPSPAFATGELILVRHNPPDIDSDSSTSESEADDDEEESWSEKVESDYAPSDGDDDDNSDYAVGMLHHSVQHAPRWSSPSVSALQPSVFSTPAEHTQQSAQATNEWLKQSWLPVTSMVNTTSQDRLNPGISLQSVFGGPQGFDGAHGLNFSSGVRHPLNGPQPQQFIDEAAGMRILADYNAHPSQEVPPSSAPSPPSPTPTVAGPSRSFNTSSLHAHVCQSNLSMSLDSGLINSLECSLSAVVKKRETVRAAGGPFDILDELEVIERSITIIQREWTALVRLARDLDKGRPESDGDLTRPLDMIRFWHLTQSALVGTLSDRERVHGLLERYYVPVDTPVDGPGPNGRIKLDRNDYRTLSMVCTTLYTYELGRVAPNSIGSDIYTFGRLERLRMVRKDQPSIPPPDQVAWTRLSQDILDRARVVLALLPSQPNEWSLLPALYESPADEVASSDSAATQPVRPLDTTAGYSEEFCGEKDDPDDFTLKEFDLSGLTLVHSDPPTAVSPAHTPFGVPPCFERHEPEPPSPYYREVVFSQGSGLETIMLGPSCSGSDGLGGLFSDTAWP